MFNRIIKFAFVCLIGMSSLVVSLAYPSRALADDGLPPTEPAPEVTTVDQPGTEPAVTTDQQVLEIIDAMGEAGAVLADENGQPIPLASETALALLQVPDPYLIRSGVTYRFLSVGGCAAFPGDPNCTESATPIQAAIDFSLDGETVFVDPGTYTEQLEIAKNIVLQATAAGTIIKSPTALTDFFMSGANTNYPIIYVHDTGNASILGFTVDGNANGDGNYRFDGIAYYNAGGTIQGNTIQNITNSTFSGTQNGVGIFVFANDGGPHDLFIDDNVITNYQKNGMTISGNGIDAEVTGNTVTGAGPTGVIAQNGIQVSGGASALIEGNTVSGNVYIPDTTVSTGILFFGPGNVEIVDNDLHDNDINAYITGAGSALVTGNTFSDGEWNGLWIDDSNSITITNNSFLGNAEGVGLDNIPDMPAVQLSGNVFTGNIVAVANYDTVDVDASGNYWGCPAGPDDPACDPVSDYVIYDPWLSVNPFVAPPAIDPVIDQGGSKDRTHAPSPDFTIPVTGGLTEIGCDSQSEILFVGQVQVMLTGLCGYQIALDALTNELLPLDLAAGEKLLFGININLFKDGTLVEKLPAGAQITISFPAIGTAMQLNAEQNSWQQIEGREVDGHFEVSAGPGTFILTSK